MHRKSSRARRNPSINKFWKKGAVHNRSILVTGGAGFIGSHLVEALITNGTEVVVVDNFATGRRENLAGVRGQVTVHEMDVRAPEWLRWLAGQSFDTIYHFASNAYVPPSVEDPLADFEINAAATLRLLQTLRDMRWQGKFIYASSAGVYGNPAKLPIAEEDPTVPISPYGVSKLAGERYTALFAQLYGMRTASVRFFSSYGPDSASRWCTTSFASYGRTRRSWRSSATAHRRGIWFSSPTPPARP
jgi:UDP-glucose 4-epimerase